MRVLLIISFILSTFNMQAQQLPEFSSFSSIPDKEGMAGMFAGVSHNQLFCMGGANFPDKKPWEGGKKIWYDKIFMLAENNSWKELEQRMPNPLAYGISVEYNNEIIIVGGNDENSFHSDVYGMEWTENAFNIKKYPSLPVQLANMAGCLVGDLIIVAGGTDGFTSLPLHTIYALDLKNSSAGWFTLPVWPGPERTQPVAGSYKGNFYLFSGEMVGVDAAGNKWRKILMDGYKFIPEKIDGKWTGTWQTLPGLPRGVSASANPVPVLNNGQFVFWGGVDAETALQTNPTTHHGIEKKVFTLDADKEIWFYAGVVEEHMARVTLPAVEWKDHWLYISGEIKPGVRTNKIISMKK